MSHFPRIKLRTLANQLRVMVIASMALSAGFAFAQDSVAVEADRVVYRKNTAIDFTNVSVVGELSKPESTYFVARRKTNFRNLIKLRGSFRPEMQRSVSSL